MYARLRRATAVGSVALLLMPAGASSAAEDGTPSWVPGRWEGTYRGIASTSGPDLSSTSGMYAAPFLFELDAVGNVDGRIEPQSGLATFTSDLGTVRVAVEIDACEFEGDTAEIRYDCHAAIDFIVPDLNRNPVEVHNEFDIEDAVLRPDAVTCTQAWGSTTTAGQEIPGTPNRISISTHWVAFRTGPVDSREMVSYVDERLTELLGHVEAGRVPDALLLLGAMVDELVDVANTVAVADCGDGNPRQLRNLFGWLEGVVEQVLQLVYAQRDGLLTNDLIHALQLGVSTGTISTGSADGTRAGTWKGVFTDLLDERLARAAAVISDPALSSGETSEQLAGGVASACADARDIGAAAQQFGMPGVASRAVSVEAACR